MQYKIFNGKYKQEDKNSSRFFIMVCILYIYFLLIAFTY